MQDSPAYLEKKKHFNALITIYGRHAVEEALNEQSIEPITLHLSTSNKHAPILELIREKAEQRDTPIKFHDKAQLSRISRNAQQDQGVALDIRYQNYVSLQTYLETAKQTAHLIALDGITNPQNLGMIIRSVAASQMDAILLPKKGCVQISPLVIKASAGTLFKAKIIYCETLEEGLKLLHAHDFRSYMLSSHATQSLFSYTKPNRTVYVLGSEHDGVSLSIGSFCHEKLIIPMHHGVESLNVAVTAAIIAFTVAP